ncbi:MAG: AarF/ABC1/UbiB kinase family protein [Alphaproteobacteria bacterium]|nr:AarF/ABC1/UbiB kinase family protein [Alphaproteobacteria bacterium]
MQIVRPIVSGVGGLGRSVSDLGRLQAVARILIRHGLGLLVAGIDLPGMPRAERELQTTPERATQAITELGPTFVKLGQILSTRPDVIPEAYCEAFTKLQDDVGALPFAEIEAELDKSLGPDWRDRVDVDEEPLATASIAQVHTGRLKDGTRVVLKVQRPGIARIIRSDLNILYFLARRLLAEVPEARSFDPLGMLGEFDRSISAELDFTIEAGNITKFQKNFAGDPEVHIPRVYDALTTAEVLCLEFLDGVTLREARAAGCDMKVVGDRYLRVAYDMLFVHGLFHGDLHPGNVIVLPGDVIGLVDFGMVGRLTAEMRNNVISIMFALQRGDYRTIARLFYEIAIKDGRLDYPAVERETVEVMQEHWSGGSIREMNMGAFVMGLAVRAARQGCRIPSNYTMLFKSIMTSEGLAKSLIEEVDPIAAIRPYFERMVAERISRESLEKEAFYYAFTMQSLLSRLPVTVSQLLDDMDAQRLRFSVRNIADPAEIAAADRRTNRVLAGSMAMTSAVCGTLALLIDSAWLGIAIALFFYAVMAALFAYTVWSVFWNRG